MWSTQGVTTVVPTGLRKRVVPSPELSRDLLIGGPAPRHEDHVESGEPKDGDDQEGNDADHDDGDEDGHFAEVVTLVEDVDQAEDEDGGHVAREGDEEHEEVAVVAATDAVVHPGAVVVEDLQKLEKKHFITNHQCN